MQLSQPESPWHEKRDVVVVGERRAYVDHKAEALSEWLQGAYVPYQGLTTQPTTCFWGKSKCLSFNQSRLMGVTRNRVYAELPSHLLSCEDQLQETYRSFEIVPNTSRRME